MLTWTVTSLLQTIWMLLNRISIVQRKVKCMVNRISKFRFQVHKQLTDNITYKHLPTRTTSSRRPLLRTTAAQSTTSSRRTIQYILSKLTHPRVAPFLQAWTWTTRWRCRGIIHRSGLLREISLPQKWAQQTGKLTWPQLRGMPIQCRSSLSYTQARKTSIDPTRVLMKHPRIHMCTRVAARDLTTKASQPVTLEQMADASTKRSKSAQQ